jgi:Prokaryotic N-terminal methylation motif
LRNRFHGFTLLELLISMSLLMVLLLLVFGAFDLGTRIFQESSVRQSAETQLRSIKVLMERDAKLANFWYTNEVSRPSVDGQRDALSLPSVSDWKDPASYDAATRRPLWDRYIVWYATLGPKGSLYRQVVEPTLAGPSLIAPYGALSANLSDSNPLSNADVVFSRVLSENVLDFEVTTKYQNGTVQAKVRLLSEGGKRAMGSDRTQDNLEVTLVFQPKNTWPAI